MIILMLIYVLAQGDPAPAWLFTILVGGGTGALGAIVVATIQARARRPDAAASLTQGAMSLVEELQEELTNTKAERAELGRKLNEYDRERTDLREGREILRKQVDELKRELLLEKRAREDEAEQHREAIHGLNSVIEEMRQRLAHLDHINGVQPRPLTSRERSDDEPEEDNLAP